MKLYSLNEITDSKLLYDKRPPKFMKYIILTVLVLVIGAIILSTKSIKTFVVKGQGIVTSKNKTNIMAKVTGEIKEVYVEEGVEVKQGDILMIFNPTEQKYQTEQIEGQIKIIQNRIKQLKRAEDELSKGKNTFNENNLEELEFYNRINSCYTKQKEFEIDEGTLKNQNYTDEQIKQYKEQANLKKQQIYYETIISITNERKQLELEMQKLTNQSDVLNNSKEEYKVFAQNSGKVHLNIPLNKGMVVQAGSLIGTISSLDEIIIETLISSSDRPRIHKDDEVQMAVLGLNQAEYGTLKGKVISIDEDATIDNEKGNIYFKVKVKPEKEYLLDKKGEKVNLTLGMVVETRVKYEKITYFKYFIEQIGVKLK